MERVCIGILSLVCAVSILHASPKRITSTQSSPALSRPDANASITFVDVVCALRNPLTEEDFTKCAQEIVAYYKSPKRKRKACILQ